MKKTTKDSVLFMQKAYRGGIFIFIGGLFYTAFHTGLLASVTISGAYPICTCSAREEKQDVQDQA